MNEVATIEQPQQPTRLDTFRLEVLPPDKADELYRSLPAHVRPEVFERNLVNALMTSPDLMGFDARLVFREVSKAAALGLYLDPQLGEAYLIVSWNGRAGRKEPQMRVGYRGLVKLARQSGDIRIIYAHEVHEHDAFRCVLGDAKHLHHEPKIFGDRGPIVGVYAVVKYENGEIDFETMTIEQVHAIRDRSDGWKAYKNGKIKSTPWATDEVEMAKKTVIRRLAKRIPQSPEMAEAFRHEDDAEYREFRTVNAPQAGITAPPPAVVAPPPPPAQEQPAEPEPETPAEAEQAPEAQAAPAAEPDPVKSFEGLNALLEELDVLPGLDTEPDGYRNWWKLTEKQIDQLTPDDRATLTQKYDALLRAADAKAAGADPETGELPEETPELRDG